MGLVVSVFATPAFATFKGSNGSVAFARGHGIVSQAPNGAEKKLLKEFGTAPSYSPNGKKIVFLRNVVHAGWPDPGWFHIWIMNADGSGKKKLTGSESRYENPSFSSNGKRILFTDYDGNPTGFRRLHTMRTDGTDRKEFAPEVGGSMEAGVWSPNGARVAYSGNTAGGLTLHTIGKTGAASSVRTLAGSRTGVVELDWSPDSKRIVFTDYVLGANKQVIYRVNADNTGLKKLADFGNDTGANDPVWSPNGRRIAFGKSSHVGNPNFQIWTMTAGGTKKTRLDRNGYDPAWQAR